MENTVPDTLYYTALGLRGMPKKVLFTQDTFRSLEPETELLDSAVDLLLYNAAGILRGKNGCDVRVVETSMMKAWLDWTELREGDTVPNADRVVNVSPPDQLRRADMRQSHHIILPWVARCHYSILIVCNAGTVPA